MWCAIGSPPRVWGQPIKPLTFFSLSRFTPTRVGTTDLGGDGEGIIPVHPHACGDNTLEGYGFRLGDRFTPTRVGTTPWPGLRWRGHTGSPPRVWGQRAGRPARAPNCPVHPHACGDNVDAFTGWVSHTRFTPTRVGTTMVIVACMVISPVHPHACGDNYVRFGRYHHHTRFTPTRVGTT